MRMTLEHRWNLRVSLWHKLTDLVFPTVHMKLLIVVFLNVVDSLKSTWKPLSWLMYIA